MSDKNSEDDLICRHCFVALIKRSSRRERVRMATFVYERNVTAVARNAEESLGTVLDKSGTILYSSCETLKPGKYYFLGLKSGRIGSEHGNNSQVSERT